MGSTDDDITVHLRHDEALVLFEWLAKHEESLSFEDPAEQVVLWRMQATLEKALVEPLAANYAEALARARRAVRERG